LPVVELEVEVMRAAAAVQEDIVALFLENLQEEGHLLSRHCR
jgi:hypothetical protein